MQGGVAQSRRRQAVNFFTAQRHASAVYAVRHAVIMCPSVNLSVTSRCSTLEHLNVRSRKQRLTIAQGLQFSVTLHYIKIIMLYIFIFFFLYFLYFMVNKVDYLEWPKYKTAKPLLLTV